MFWTPMEFPMTLEYSPWNYQCPQQGVHEYKMQWTKAIIDLQISKKKFHKKKMEREILKAFILYA